MDTGEGPGPAPTSSPYLLGKRNVAGSASRAQQILWGVSTPSCSQTSKRSFRVQARRHSVRQCGVLPNTPHIVGTPGWLKGIWISRGGDWQQKKAPDFLPWLHCPAAHRAKDSGVQALRPRGATVGGGVLLLACCPVVA